MGILMHFGFSSPIHPFCCTGPVSFWGGLCAWTDGSATPSDLRRHSTVQSTLIRIHSGGLWFPVATQSSPESIRSVCTQWTRDHEWSMFLGSVLSLFCSALTALPFPTLFRNYAKFIWICVKNIQDRVETSLFHNTWHTYVCLYMAYQYSDDQWILQCESANVSVGAWERDLS